MSRNFNWKDFQPWRRNDETSPNQNPNPNQAPNSGPGAGRNSRDFVEEVRVSGKNLVGEVERLLKEGNIRRLRIRQGDKILLDLPVAWAAVGALFAPQLALVGALAATVSHCTIEVVRSQDAPSSSGPVTRSAAGPVNPARPTTPPTPTNPDDLSYR